MFDSVECGRDFARCGGLDFVPSWDEIREEVVGDVPPVPGRIELLRSDDGFLGAVSQGAARSAAPALAPLILIERHLTEVRRDSGGAVDFEGGAGVVIKCENYANGNVRMWARVTRVDSPLNHQMPEDFRPAVREKSDQERFEESVRRSKKVVMQRCLSMGVDRFLTLTYRENMQERERLARDFDSFRRKMQAAGLLSHYVAVPELQKRGAFHLHVAIRGYLPVTTVRRFWCDVVGGPDRGPEMMANVQIAYDVNRDKSPHKIAAYIAKYVGKSFGSGLSGGERSYWSSRSWTKPQSWAFFVQGVDPVLVGLAVGRAFMEIVNERGLQSSQFVKYQEGLEGGFFMFAASRRIDGEK